MFLSHYTSPEQKTTKPRGAVISQTYWTLYCARKNRPNLDRIKERPCHGHIAWVRALCIVLCKEDLPNLFKIESALESDKPCLNDWLKKKVYFFKITSRRWPLSQWSKEFGINSYCIELTSFKEFFLLWFKILKRVVYFPQWAKSDQVVDYYSCHEKSMHGVDVNRFIICFTIIRVIWQTKIVLKKDNDELWVSNEFI
jgi:hypothetical protein